MRHGRIDGSGGLSRSAGVISTGETAPTGCHVLLPFRIALIGAGAEEDERDENDATHDDHFAAVVGGQL